MNDPIAFLQMAAAIGLLAGPPILLARLLGDSNDGGLAALLTFPAELPLPRGVQEEDPPAWRLENVRARSRQEALHPDVPRDPSPCGPDPRPSRNLRLGARS